MTKPWITFQDQLKYTFKLQNLLQEALTHKSWAHEMADPSELFTHNERLEFLGDAVLDLSVSSLLMHDDFRASEGELSKRRASLVNEVTLAEIARELDLSDYLILGHGEESTRGREKASILASAFEALLGAVYIDGGYDEALKIVERLLINRIKEMKNSQPFLKDYKTRLQEVMQSKYKRTPSYVIEKTEGPEHEKTFQVAVMLGEKKLCSGNGKSRKEAEQNAARRILEEFER
jgi:ribonuclease III